MGEWLIKALAAAGVASRRQVAAMIAEGRVQLNGKVVVDPAVRLTTDDNVCIDGKPIAVVAPPLALYRFHKPRGTLTTRSDPEGRPIIYDLLPKDAPRLMPVGRLDMNSEGLLLLTPHGGLKRHLELPSTGLERHYRVRVFGRPSDADLAALGAGMTVDGVRYDKIKASIDSSRGDNTWLSLILWEGKNREIRRVMEALGFTVNRLIRTGYGSFKLGDLPPGGLAEVPAGKVRGLFKDL
ncbi:MAG: pseudouridine synthase [Holosporales bacterium]|jgi:23S rRNA pseudouridine2605 synthase